MNREIKFRAWDKAAKRMSSDFSVFGEFTLVGGVHSWQHESGIEGGSLERLRDLVIMQYTGLKDKNGKDIYEGDIVLSNGKLSRLIIWSEPYFTWYAHNGNNEQLQFPLAHYKMWSGDGDTSIEVIGNIYEDPELLNS